MSFDFGSNREADPTSDFVSKFPDLDGDDADAALTAAATGAPSGITNAAPPQTASTTSLADFGEEDDEDLLGGGGGFGGSQSASVATSAKPKDEREQFESTFPELDDPDLDNQGQGGLDAQHTAYATPSNNTNGFLTASTTSIPGRGPSPPTNSNNISSSRTPYAFDQADDDEEEPEPLRQWRHTQAEEIAKRDAQAERQRSEAISQAERDIDQFYSEYNAKKEKNIKKNKEDEANFTEKRSRELAEGTTWDRITKLVELQNSQSKTIAVGGAGSTDLTRFKGE